MAYQELASGIFAVGALDPTRRLFDELIPLPDGTSYNAYLVKGSEKVALLDTVDPPMADQLLANVAAASVTNIDYVIAHHAEQDHAGSLPQVLKKFPQAKLVTNAKCKELLQDLMPIDPERFMLVGEGDTIDLGGRTLRFVLLPWVHWPETMATYLVEDRILFPCDLFGSHLAQSELFVTNEQHTYRAAKRYYAEIMMPFRSLIQKHLRRLGELEIDIIAPSHGPVYRDPAFIMDAYRDWTSDEVKNEVIIPYISMHGSTRGMVDYVRDKLEAQGVVVKLFHLTEDDVGDLAMALVDAATILLASPTVLAGAHPQAVFATYLVNVLKPKAKQIGLMGSYGWGSRIVEQVKGLLTNFKGEMIEPVLIKGVLTTDDLAVLDQLVNTIVIKHRILGLMK
jgi:flavorubredoxin